MTEENKTKLIQSEINYRAPQAQKDFFIGKASTCLIGSLAFLGLLMTMDTAFKTPEDNLKALSAVLWLGWAYLRTANIKTNTQNRLIYNSLRANEETELDQIETFCILKNTASAAITFGTSTLSIFIPVIASGLGYMSSGMAATACASICIAGETYIKSCFKSNNLFLKSKLPRNILLPKLSKTREKE